MSIFFKTPGVIIDKLDNDCTYADVIVHQKINPLTNKEYIDRFEWAGSDDQILEVNEYFAHELLPLVPWQLEEVQVNDDLYRFNTRFFIRRDNYYYSINRFQIDCLWLSNKLHNFGRKLILTAMVWGLAYVPSGCIPSVKHLGRKRS